MPASDGPQIHRVGIGALLRQLQPRFPELTASKVRFLEDQGLVRPLRSASGYRKYSQEDAARLEAVLTLQRERYLPLRVIRDRLDRGEDPAQGTERQESVSGGPGTGVGTNTAGPSGDGGARYTLRELAARSGTDIALLRELLDRGLLVERTGTFDGHALTVATAAGKLNGYGIEPRHLRALRGASERVIALVEGSISPLRNRRDPETRRRAVQQAHEIAALCLTMMTALVTAQVEETVQLFASPDADGGAQ